MANKIIDYSDPGIVVRENTVHLSDEKLRNVLLRTYERAQMDMSAMKIHKFYSIFLSIAGTLFMSLLTSKFNAIGSISAKSITKTAWAVCIVFAIIGFILLAIHVSQKNKTDTRERDTAVDEIFEKHFSKE